MSILFISFLAFLASGQSITGTSNDYLNSMMDKEITITVGGVGINGTAFIRLKKLYQFELDNQYSCASPIEEIFKGKKTRTPEKNVTGTSHTIVVNFKDFHPGEYILCYKKPDERTIINVTSTIIVPEGPNGTFIKNITTPTEHVVEFTWEDKPSTIRVSGPISPYRHTITCDGNWAFTAGSIVSCKINFTDTGGFQAGSPAEVCNLIVQPTEGNGDDIDEAERVSLPEFKLDTKTFDFTFTPKKSGCFGSIKAFFNDVQLQRVAYTVNPGTFTPGRPTSLAVSTCKKIASNKCVNVEVSKRDVFDNIFDPREDTC